MTPFDSLLATFQEELRGLHESAAFQWLRSDRFGAQHYASVLREIYFYTRDNPQLQVSLTLRFRGEQRQAVRRIIGHAMDEIGHDQMALHDLAVLGVDTKGIEDERPLPSTMGLLAYPVYVMSQGNSIGYLGQIFFLEFMPTQAGGEYLRILKKAGVPEGACSFIAEHAEVDEHHNRLMKHHVADLVRTEADLRACQEAIRVCAHHYAQMLLGAMEEAERRPLTLHVAAESSVHA